MTPNRRALMASGSAEASVAALPPVDLDRMVLVTQVTGLLEGRGDFDFVLGGVRYAGKPFDMGRYFGLAAMIGGRSHAVTGRAADIAERGASTVAGEMVDELRRWVANHG